MFEFHYPWLLSLLPLPLLVWWLMPAHKEARAALRTPFFDQLLRETGRRAARGAVVLKPSIPQRLLLPVWWALLVVALARPQWVEDPITKIESARDLMLAVDLSGSMDTEDFKDPQGKRIQRLDAVKLVLDDFIERRKGDRLGLIFFGSAAFLQVPFTQDHDACRALLDEARVRMAGRQTKLGDAIGLAITLFEESKNDDRVLVLLTDGNDTGSRMPPSKAAEIAAGRGVVIHTVAIGDIETVGERKLDEASLREIASITQGRFYRANDRQQLESIYRELDELVPQQFETLSYRPRRPLFHWPLAAALVLFIVAYGVSVLSSALRREASAHA